MPAIWSGTDFPYMCLKDRARTLAFRHAIRSAVRPGDVVIDAGAGTGILSFFAAQVGARRVYAVEIDPLLVTSLRRSIALNGLDDIVTVVAGDASNADLPAPADVFIGEMIETGLLDEMQVPVMNALRGRGVITASTRMIPERYTTFVELVADTSSYYGFQLAGPKHEWPFYAHAQGGWHSTTVTPLTDRVAVARADFHDYVVPRVASRVTVTGIRDGVANGLRLSGRVQLTPGISLGATNALNGDKILHLDHEVQIAAGETAELRLQYGLGEGLASLRCNVSPPASCH